jgi:glycosyltransferase EpsD
MKILYVTTISNTINAFLIPHIKLLIDKGHIVDIACNIHQEVDSSLLKMGCKVFNVDFQRTPLSRGNWKSLKKIKKIVLQNNYKIVHTHTPVASFITRLACSRIPHVKLLYTAHGFHFYKGAPMKNWLIYYTIEKLASKWTDIIITLNNEDYSNSQRLKKKNAHTFIVNGVGVSLSKFLPQTQLLKRQYREKYNFEKNDFILIYVAELNYNKHQDLLIETVNCLKNKISNLKLLLVGTGDLLEQYKQQVNKLGLEDFVYFLGFRKDVNNLMMISDVAVSASRREGLPVNIMEAMATGLPLVVSDCRGNKDLVNHKQNGLIVVEDTPEAFASHIYEIYNSKRLRETFSKKNIELINQYNQESVLKSIEVIYKKIITK